MSAAHPVHYGLFHLLSHFVTETGHVMRYGPPSDGGYVVPSLPFTRIISIGVGGNIGFEKDYSDRHPGTRFHLFDPTVAALPHSLPNAVFEKIGLGCGRRRLSLDALLGMVPVSKDDCVLLKIDCEGAEWECGLESADLSGISAIAIELHGLGNPSLSFIHHPVIARLWRDFKCLNIHPCNYAGTFDYAGVSIPRVVELTFLARRIVQKTFNEPSNHPCNPRAPELEWVNPAIPK